MVLDRVRVTLLYSEPLLASLIGLTEGREELSLSADPEAGRIYLDARGRSAHAAAPAGSVNAAAVAAELLASSEALSVDERGVLASAALFLSDPYGGTLGIAGRDGPFGGRTAVNGMVRVRGGRLLLSEDIRYGIPATFAELYPAIAENVEAEDWEAHLVSEGDGYDVGDADPLAEVLLASYRRLTGVTDAKPYRSGGGTYARHLPRAFSHGLTVPGIGPSPAAILGEGHGDPHRPDECIPVESYLAAMRILIEYAQVAADFVNNE